MKNRGFFVTAMQYPGPKGMKLLIAGGASGGHLYPGVAVAQKWMEKKGNSVLFVGTRQGLESRVLPKLGFPVRFTIAGPINGVGIYRKLISIAKLPIGLLHGLWIVLAFRPDVVLCLGGYASGMVSLAALFLRRPLVIFEPNRMPGITNRRLARFACRVGLSFEGAAKHFLAGKTVLTGTPLRGELFLPGFERTKHQGPLKVLILGGSQGSPEINDLLIRTLPLISKEAARFEFRHQTGLPYFDEVSAAYANSGVSGEAVPFIEEMARSYQWADLAISSAGAVTCAETAAVGLPTLFIPLAKAANCHQALNAREMAEQGAAWFKEQHELSSEYLARFLFERDERREELIEIGNKARSAMQPDATKKIVEILVEAAKGESSD